MAKPGTTFHFTAEGVKALKPAATRVEYWDASLTGFGLRVTPRGAKTWFYWYRRGHVKRRWTIGRFPQLSLANARQQARDAYGKDPAGEKVDGRHAPTFGALGDAYLRLHAKPHKKSWGPRPGMHRAGPCPVEMHPCEGHRAEDGPSAS